MSQFIDRLKRISRTAPRSIGFKAAVPASEVLKMQLVAALGADGAEQLTGSISGADAVLLSVAKPAAVARALPGLLKTLPGVPFGVRFQSGKADIKALVKAGADFAVFASDSAVLNILQDDTVGKIVAVEPSLSEGLLRALNELPVDAVLVGRETDDESAITWQRLMLCRRFADLLNKPLLVAVPAAVTAAELQAVWDAGVSGVLVAVSAGLAQNRLQELRQTIDNLAFPASRGQQEREVRLPGIRPPANIVTAGEEDDEED